MSEAQTMSEKLLAQANAQASQLHDQAESSQAQGLSVAAAEASRFNALVDQFDQAATPDSETRTQIREMTMQRLYWSALEELLPKLARQIYVDGEKPIDLTIQRRDSRP